MISGTGTPYLRASHHSHVTNSDQISHRNVGPVYTVPDKFTSAHVFVKVEPVFTRHLPICTKICPDSRTQTCPVTQRTNCELVWTNICAALCKRIFPYEYLNESKTRPRNSLK